MLLNKLCKQTIQGRELLKFVINDTSDKTFLR